MSDKLYVVRLPDNRGMITCTNEVKARESLAKNPGATFSYRPFPSTVKMPWIGKDDYAIEYKGIEYGYVAHYLPIDGVYGCGDDAREAYSVMLRAISDHLEAQTEIPLDV